MRSLLALALWSSMALSAAATPCVESNRDIEGTLSEVRRNVATGLRLKAFHLILDATTCASVVGLDGAPNEIGEILTVEIVPSNASGERAMLRLDGARVRVSGTLDAPDPDRHSGDVVMTGAELREVVDTGTAEGSVASGEGDAVDSTAAAEPPVEEAAAEDLGSVRDFNASGAAEERRQDATKKKLARFVLEFLLSGRDVPADIIRGIYAPRVHYYGKRGVPLARVVKDKLAYFKRWPDRRFTLAPESLDIRRIGYAGEVYDITYDFDFEARGPGRVSAGRGYGRFTVDLTEGEGKILRESGKVVARN